MEFKLSYEMWCVGRWAVSIPLVRYKYQQQREVSRFRLICQKKLFVRKEKNILSSDSPLVVDPGICLGLQASWEGDQLTFTVHLEEKDSPENLHWEIKKTYMDIVYFRNRWQVDVLR